MRPTIIAVSGPMGSGKSTLIKVLKEHLSELQSNTQIKLVKFAQPLYDMQNAIYARANLPVPTTASGEAKDRTLLQYLGTEWGRSKDQNLWVNIWKSDVVKAKEESDTLVVCDDCRFDNEAEAIKAMGGVVVKISTAKNGERIDITHSNHASENGISNTHVDYIIENNDSLDHYKNQLTYLFSKLGLR